MWFKEFGIEEYAIFAYNTNRKLYSSTYNHKIPYFNHRCD